MLLCNLTPHYRQTLPVFPLSFAAVGSPAVTGYAIPILNRYGIQSPQLVPLSQTRFSSRKIHPGFPITLIEYCIARNKLGSTFSSIETLRALINAMKISSIKDGVLQASINANKEDRSLLERMKNYYGKQATIEDILKRMKEYYEHEVLIAEIEDTLYGFQFTDESYYSDKQSIQYHSEQRGELLAHQAISKLFPSLYARIEDEAPKSYALPVADEVLEKAQKWAEENLDSTENFVGVYPVDTKAIFLGFIKTLVTCDAFQYNPDAFIRVWKQLDTNTADGTKCEGATCDFFDQYFKI